MRTRLLGGLGALATLAAVAVLVRPDLGEALPGVAVVLEPLDTERLLLALGSVVGGYALWTARASPPERTPTDGPSVRFADAGDPPESVSAADRTRTGESFDARVAAACDGDDRALDDVRATLADVAAEALSRASDCEARTARRAVETGGWTDDPVATAFLAGESGPSFPLVARLRAWLDPGAERRRRVERTVEVVSRLFDGETVEQGPAGRVEREATGRVEREATGRVEREATGRGGDP